LTEEGSRMGRRPMLTPELQARIVDVVKAGSYLKVAAQHAGVSNASLMAWLARGRKAVAAAEEGEPIPEHEQRYVDFLEAVTRADTHAEVLAATAWRAAFKDDWRAARDFLVRRHPDRWAATTRIQMSTDEADARIERAVQEALASVGVDGEPSDLGDLDLDVDGEGEPRDF
jgi:hypothetical protein